MPASVQSRAIPAGAVAQVTGLSSLPPPRSFTIIRIVLGLLLLTTASLKLAGGSNQIARTVLPFLSPRLYLAGVVFEAVLGTWLLMGIAPVWSWLTSVGFFSLLGYMSLRLGLMGQSSCGCLGASVHLNPWWAFLIDISAVTALLATYPRHKDGIASLRWPRLFAVSAKLAVAVGYLILSSLPDSRELEIDPAVIELGDVPQQGDRLFEFNVHNRGSDVQHVSWIETSCPCLRMVVESVDVPPRGMQRVSARLDMSREPTFAGNLDLKVVGEGSGGRKVVAIIAARIVHRRDDRSGQEKDLKKTITRSKL